MFDDEVLIHHVIAPGPAGSGMDAPEYAALRADITEILSRPTIARLLDVPDVTGTPADNDTIVYDADTDTWSPGAVSGSVAKIRDGSGREVLNVTEIVATDGVALAATSGNGRVYLQAVLAGTGASSQAAARSDHDHPLRIDALFTAPASGALSSGTRTLVPGTITGLDPAKSYLLKGRLKVDLRGQGTGAGQTLPSITIGATTQPRPEGECRTVSGVDMPYGSEHPGVIVSGVSSVSVSASIQYRSGDPVYVAGSALFISIGANR